MADSVWVVTTPDYESNDINAVFSSEELANTYAAGADGRDVEEWPIRSSLPEPITHLHLSCTIGGRPRAITRRYETTETIFPGIDAAREPFVSAQRVSLFHEVGWHWGQVWVSVRGTDTERVRAFYESETVFVLEHFEDIIAAEMAKE